MIKGRSGAFVRIAALGLVLPGLAACTAPGPAPVNDRTRTATQTEVPRPVTPQIAASTNGLHTVQRGDTLYAIAFANGLDYRDIAIWNHLESADRIMVGQVLRLTPPPGGVEIMPLDDESAPRARPLAEPPVLREPQAVLLVYSDANWAQASSARPVASALPAVAPAATRPASATPAAAAPPSAPPASAPPVTATAAPASGPVENWLWPAEGTLAGRFGEAGGKGIDIVGPRNTPVLAVAPGKVVYSGSGLRGYGQLLIIKHSGEFLSAYAHNAKILVKEGDMVTAGERIALMGDSDAGRVALHFEIRRYGKPLDPLNYLPERS